MCSTSSTLTVKALCPASVEDGGKTASVLYHPFHCPQLLWAKDIQGNASPQGAKAVLEKKSAPLRASWAESFLQATGVKPIVVGCCSRRGWFDLLLGALSLGCYGSRRSPKGYQEMHDNATPRPCSFAYDFSV